MMSQEDRGSWAFFIVASLTLLVALGVARLSPHEAISAQTAREMIASGDFLIPKIGGLPWLEKPPLASWLIAASGLIFGRITEFSARLPSALAALGLGLGVVSLASKRLGPRIGWLAGLIQITTPWLIVRGRLAEVDVMLTSLIVGAMAAFDRVRLGSGRARWVFFVLIGVTSLAKGIGFGAVLIGAACLVVIVWDRDFKTLRALLSPLGIGLSLAIALAWPILVLRRYPQALGLWTMHVTDRLAARSSHFAGEGWLEYLGTPIVFTLPWTPFATLGAIRSFSRAKHEQNGLDRLLFAWALVPAILVSLASARNGHYLIHALPPLSIWAAMSLDRLRALLEGHGGQAEASRRGWQAKACPTIFVVVALAWAVGFAVVGRRINSRDSEFAFYERVGKTLAKSESLILLCDLERPDRWDREPYPTPFGPMPTDLAPRLYYLDREAPWRASENDLLARPPVVPFAAIGRERDRESLSRLGLTTVLMEGPGSRWDRTFFLYRVTRSPRPEDR